MLVFHLVCIDVDTVFHAIDCNSPSFEFERTDFTMKRAAYEGEKIFTKARCDDLPDRFPSSIQYLLSIMDSMVLSEAFLRLPLPAFGKGYLCRGRARLTTNKKRINHAFQALNVNLGTAGHIVADIASSIEETPPWTLDQIAGLVFAGLLLAFYLSSRYIDRAVAQAQRRSMGLCEECGGLYDPTSCPEPACKQRMDGGKRE